MRRGESPILEDGLPELIAEGLASRAAVVHHRRPRKRRRGADFVFLCVPTPQGADGAADLRFVEAGRRPDRPASQARGGRRHQVDRPGRVGWRGRGRPGPARHGRGVEPRVPAGGQRRPRLAAPGPDRDRQPTTPAAAERLAGLYQPLDAPVLITDPASSETMKYACNAFLAAKVSFINAIANLCEAVGADSVDVIRGMSYDRRIGADHLAPGPAGAARASPRTPAP